jgi:hypothetical protein
MWTFPSRSVDVSIEDVSTNLVGGRVKRYIRLRQLGVADPKYPLDNIRTIAWFTGDTLVTLRLNETLKTWSVRYQQATIREPVITDKL